MWAHIRYYYYSTIINYMHSYRESGMTIRRSTHTT